MKERQGNSSRGRQSADKPQECHSSPMKESSKKREKLAKAAQNLQEEEGGRRYCWKTTLAAVFSLHFSFSMGAKKKKRRV